MESTENGVFISAKCEKTGKDFFVEAYKAYDGTWVFAYGVETLPRQKAGHQGSTGVLLTSAQSGPQFSCPHCGHRHSFTCCVCGKNTCFDGNTSGVRKVICSHCGTELYFTTKPNPSGGVNLSGVSGNGQ